MLSFIRQMSTCLVVLSLVFGQMPFFLAAGSVVQAASPAFQASPSSLQAVPPASLEVAPNGLLAPQSLITVTALVDDMVINGNCTLREAVQAANTDVAVDACAAGSGADTLVLLPGTYTLAITGTGENDNQTGDLDVVENLSISGAGDDVSIINGGDIDRLFHIFAGTTVAISGTLLEHGLVMNENGGAIYNNGTLSLVNSMVENNTAIDYLDTGGEGGGVYNLGTLNVVNSTISGTKAIDAAINGAPTGGDGGCIFNTAFATVNILDNSALIHCQALDAGGQSGATGGGITNFGEVLVIDSTIGYNWVIDYAGVGNFYGGGIYSGNQNNNVLLINSYVISNVMSDTIVANRRFDGAGLYNVAGVMEINNTVVRGNESLGSTGNLHNGGGVYNTNVNGRLSIVNGSVIADNYSANEGGGVYNDAGVVTITQAVIDNNVTSFGGGGILNMRDGVMTLSQTQVSNNESNTNGGGIHNRTDAILMVYESIIASNTTKVNAAGSLGGGMINSSVAFIVDSMIFGNLANANSANGGGGIANINGGTLVLSQTAIFSNSAKFHGGGLYNDAVSTATLMSLYVYNNEADVDSNGSGNGGAVYNLGSLTDANSIFEHNHALKAGALHNSGAMTLSLTIVATNTSEVEVGGVFNQGQLWAMGVVLTDNYAGGEVGGLDNDGDVWFTDGMIIANRAHDDVGGVDNAGNLYLNNSLIADNAAVDGVAGGVRNSGTAWVQDSFIEGNYALDSAGNGGGNGGGVYNLPAGEMHVATTTIRYNHAQDRFILVNSAYGGGVYNAGDLYLTDVWLDQNEAVNLTTVGTSGQGGGVYNAAGNMWLTDISLMTNTASFSGGAWLNRGTMVMSQAVVADNYAGAWGGGGTNMAGVVDLLNVTIANNQAQDSGGGIYHHAGSVISLTNVTIGFNEAISGTGGGLYNEDVAVVHNTLVAHNAGGDCMAVAGITSLGYNLTTDATCALTATGDITAVTAYLGQLQDNGGKTETQALRYRSPAVDAGDPDICPAVDQRGYERPLEGDGDIPPRCDIGAFEAMPVSVSITKAASPEPAYTGAVLTYTLFVENTGPASSTQVVVTDTLPLGVSFMDITVSQGTCPVTSPVVCDLGALDVDASATITMHVLIDFGTLAFLTNTAQAIPYEPDLDETDNYVTVTTHLEMGQRTVYLPIVLK